MIKLPPSIFQVIRQTYEAHGITVADIAEKRIRKHIFLHRNAFDEFVASGAPETTLPPFSGFSFRDISPTELNAVAKELGAELGVTLTVLPREYSGLPFFEITISRVDRERKNK